MTCSKTGRASNRIQGKGNTSSPHHPVSTLTPIYSSFRAPRAHQLQNTKRSCKKMGIFALKSHSRDHKMNTFLKFLILLFAVNVTSKRDSVTGFLNCNIQVFLVSQHGDWSKNTEYLLCISNVKFVKNTI